MLNLKKVMHRTCNMFTLFSHSPADQARRAAPAPTARYS